MSDKIMTRKDWVINRRCPYIFNWNWDDIDKHSKKVDNRGHVIGCRNITCEQCWNKPAKKE